MFFGSILSSLSLLLLKQTVAAAATMMMKEEDCAKIDLVVGFREVEAEVKAKA